MDISYSGGTLGIILVLIFAGLIGLVYFMRSVYNKRSEKALQGEYRAADDANKSYIANRAKYEPLDVFGLSSTFFNFGLALAVGLSLLAFGWTQYSKEIYIPDGALDLDEEIEMEPPRTAEPPPPPPPPPPPVIEEVPEDELIEEDPPEFEDTSVDENTVMEAPPEVKVEKAPPPPPPPPPPPAPKVDEIFKVVEQMPLFPGCEDISSYADRKACADKKMLEFIYGNIKYPAIARENGVEGMAVVSFVVEKDGTVTDAKVVRNPGAKTGEEALRVVEMMNEKGLKWTPGKQGGRSVRVQFNLPVKFKLE
ncbi:TonB family protein [Neolewinella lacunae]|uniref:TonB family protein n=1 Tax=Neolewinella lacunae TaxID=1517758 RepID=A0A923TAF3_9BACT|nr:energy transducer TonB [Neolewinella lacunae]MBC6996444.1 TonB family protein [Neolewinella lacunae]MDN3633613.1 TonB family protein [Neolewinella lacunae]